jgi:hypothetical protein
LIVIAYQNSDLPHSLEVHRLGEHLVGTLADPDLPECNLGKSGGKLADWDVFSPNRALGSRALVSGLAY